MLGDHRRQPGELFGCLIFGQILDGYGGGAHAGVSRFDGTAPYGVSADALKSDSAGHPAYSAAAAFSRNRRSAAARASAVTVAPASMRAISSCLDSWSMTETRVVTTSSLPALEIR